MSQFDKLIEELGLIAKSMPAEDDGKDDDKIQAAADGAVDGGGDVDPADDDMADDGYGDDDQEPMSKSLVARMPDGTEIEAVDGTELVKSLMERVEASEAKGAEVLGSVVGLLKQQTEMVKSLQEQVARLSGEGRGRKTVVSVNEKKAVTMAKSQGAADGISPNEFMAKALAAQASGRLTGLDVARCESALNKGLPIPADVLARVTQ